MVNEEDGEDDEGEEGKEGRKTQENQEEEALEKKIPEDYKDWTRDWIKIEITGGSHLSWIFWENENVSQIISNPAYQY